MGKLEKISAWNLTKVRNKSEVIDEARTKGAKVHLFEKILLKYGWEKVSNWECLFVHRPKGLFLSVYVDDIKFGWKETKH